VSRALRRAVWALSEEAWQDERRDREAVRQWDEVAFVPAGSRSPQPQRYLAIPPAPRLVGE